MVPLPLSVSLQGSETVLVSEQRGVSSSGGETSVIREEKEIPLSTSRSHHVLLFTGLAHLQLDCVVEGSFSSLSGSGNVSLVSKRSWIIKKKKQFKVLLIYS